MYKHSPAANPAGPNLQAGEKKILLNEHPCVLISNNLYLERRQTYKKIGAKVAKQRQGRPTRPTRSQCYTS